MSKERWSRFLKVYDPLKAGSIDGTDTRPHDRGIERAAESIYVPNKDLDSEPSKTLFVGRLSPGTTEETLQEAFSKFGEIKSLNLIRDIVTGFSKQYAFVEFELRTDAAEACERMNSHCIDNHGIFVDWECGRLLPKWIPRRLGGGFGGRKESGQLRFGGLDRPFKKPFIIGREPQDNQTERGDRRGGIEGVGYGGGWDRRNESRVRDRGHDRKGGGDGSDGEGSKDGGNRGSREGSRVTWPDRRNDSRGGGVRVKREPRDENEEHGRDTQQRVRVKQEPRERDRDRNQEKSRERSRDRDRSRNRSRSRSRESGRRGRSRSRERDRRSRSGERHRYHGDRERRRIKKERDSGSEDDRRDKRVKESRKKRRFTEVKGEEDS